MIAGIISYYLAAILDSIGVKNTLDQASLNLGLQIWNLLLSGVGALASERYGRRMLWLLSTIFMLVSMAVVATLTGLYAENGISSAGVAVIPTLFLFFAAYDISYAALFFAYPVEILPFELRAKGLAVTLLSDSIGIFSNQFANPVAFSRMKWRYYCVFLGFLSFFLFSIYFFFPETKGRSLEEVSQIFHKEKYKGQHEEDKEIGIQDGIKGVNRRLKRAMDDTCIEPK
jgi:MFS family permease